MSRFTKYTLSFLALICALSIAICIPTIASATISSDGDWEYEPHGFGTITLTRYLGSDTDLIIPSMIDGYQVIKLEKLYRDGGCDNIISLVISEGITEISEDCFCDSALLEEVQFPRSLEMIGPWAFASSSIMTDIVLYDEIRHVGQGAFASTSASVKINLPAGNLLLIYEEDDNPAPTYLGHSIFSVLFNTTGGSIIAPATVSWGDTVARPFPDPMKTDYVFVDWYTDFAGTQLNVFSAPIKGDLVLYAKWVPTNPTITFEANGGSPVPTSQKVVLGAYASEPTAPQLIGKTLVGWFSTSDFETGTQWDFNTDPVMDDLTLYAKWVTTQFAIAFMADGGTPAPTTQIIDWGMVVAKPSSMTRTGYTTDDKWYTDNGYTQEFSFATQVYQAYTLYAKWTINRHEVTFDTMGGVPIPGVQLVDYNSFISEPDNVIYAGNVLEGWYTNPSFTPLTKWSFILNRMPDNNITLYARWLPLQLPWGDYQNLLDPYESPVHPLDDVSNLANSLEVKYGLSCFDQGCHGIGSSSGLPDLLEIHDRFFTGDRDPWYLSCQGSGCHESSLIPASGASCDACHDISAIHASAITTLFDKHATLTNPASEISSIYGACDNCHTSGCGGCHSGAISTTPNLIPVHEKPAEADTCRVCHASSGNWVSHIPYSTVRALVLNGTTPNTGKAECLDCHTEVHDEDTHSDVPTTHAFVDDITGCGTAGCHVSLDGASTLMQAHYGSGGASTDAQTCAICHGSSEQDVIDAIAAGKTGCFDGCHTEHGAISHDGSGYYATRPDLPCAHCHDPEGGLVSIHLTNGCETCHTPGASQSVKDAISARNDFCDACHDVHPMGAVTTSHDAAAYYASAPNETGVACEVCHSTDTVATHKPYSNCLTCHSGSARPSANGIPDIGCSNCHASSPSTAIHRATEITSKHANAGGDDTCARCHESMESLVGLDIITVHDARGCATCHSPGARRAVRDAVARGGTNCTDCHHNNSPYLDWQDANNIYIGSGGSTAQDTPHGGYTTSTVKCAVCHSVHRASADSFTLTAADSCLNCHTAWGSGGSVKLIEWENPALGAVSGPHTSQGCLLKCHGGSVHGASRSQFFAMNHFMLGDNADATLLADFEAGNVNASITYVVGGGSGEGANWFQSGTARVPWDGAPPAGVTAAQFAAAKATATGYTCSQSGCHDVSNNGGQYVVHTDGFVGVDTMRTGHGTGVTKDVAGTVRTGCGPCHPGNAAGGYRRYDNIVNPNARAYGCDQCHDLIGKATNSTAWPHASVGID
ncbi:MAG: InlB B-repeat-containing protein, partial [Coriobacteriia bacterium]|nr:InlB B-repeat-containing protein [Coriobacteriia bacterium]